MSSKSDWIDELFDEDEKTLFNIWRMGILKSIKYQETDNFQETAWYYIDQIRNDEHIPDRDLRSQFNKRMERDD